MSPNKLILIFLLISLNLHHILSSSSSNTKAPTAYDLLESYDFPVGILPNGVTGYELNNQTGEFKLFLGQTCKFHIESYDLEYKSTVSGVISKDRLTNLKGVSVKILFFWLNIVEVIKVGDELQFSVGIASANFPLDGFEESPTCGCGFDCDTAVGLIGNYEGLILDRIGDQRWRSNYQNPIEGRVSSS